MPQACDVNAEVWWWDVSWLQQHCQNVEISMAVSMSKCLSADVKCLNAGVRISRMRACPKGRLWRTLVHRHRYPCLHFVSNTCTLLYIDIGTYVFFLFPPLIRSCIVYLFPQTHTSWCGNSGIQNAECSEYIFRVKWCLFNGLFNGYLGPTNSVVFSRNE